MKGQTELIIRTETREILSVRRTVIRKPDDARCSQCGRHVEPDFLQTPAGATELELQGSDNETV